MTGLLARINEQPRDVLDAIAASMNVRASEPAMQAICARYMAQISLPVGARVLEIGCGNGAATRLIMQHMDPAQLVGIDPSPVFVEMAAAAFAGEPRVSFAVADAMATGQADAFFDLVIAHTVYSHLLNPKAALTEARRVLRPGGLLVIFDGDFATLTVALFKGDPLQTAAEAVLRNLVHAPYIMSRRVAPTAEPLWPCRVGVLAGKGGSTPPSPKGRSKVTRDRRPWMLQRRQRTTRISGSAWVDALGWSITLTSLPSLRSTTRR